MNKILFLMRLHKKALLITVAGVISAGAIATYVAASHDTAVPTAPPAPTATLDLPAPTAPQYPGRVGEDTGDGSKIYSPGPTTTPDPAMIAVARKFATAWARPELGAEAWLAGVDDYGTNDYLRPLRNINPANVPATAVTGDPTVVTARTDQAVIDVPTDAGTLRLTLVSLVGKWWVSETEMVGQTA